LSHNSSLTFSCQISYTRWVVSIQVAAGEKEPHLFFNTTTDLLLCCSTTATATGNSLFRTLCGTGIRAGSLTMSRQIATVAHATVAANFNQAFYIHLHFSAQIALNLEILGYVFTQRGNLSLGQIFDPGIRAYLRGFEDLTGPCGTNPKNGSQTNFDPLISRKINTFYSRHSPSLTLSLFVLWVFADHEKSSAAFYDLAFCTSFAN
jgi:hypothetical protein